MYIARNFNIVSFFLSTDVFHLREIYVTNMKNKEIDNLITSTV